MRPQAAAVPARAAALAAVPALLAALALSGCLGAAASDVAVVPFVALGTAGPGRAVEFALHLTSLSPFRQDLEVTAPGLPPGWTVEPEAQPAVLDGRATSALLVRIAPPEDARHGVHPIRLDVGDGRTEVFVNVGDLGDEPAREGVGARVRTVGFWGNGTIFYTNMKEVRDEARIPWRELEPGAKNDTSMEELKVYVGGKRRTPPPEPYNSSGYVPVIKGFDERLRGMRAGETLTVRVPPEKAYTLPGNEDHPLYGDALTFLVQVTSVDVLPRDDSVRVPCGDLPVCPPPPIRPSRLEADVVRHAEP